MSGVHPGLSNNFVHSGEKFEWSKDNAKSIKKIISKYPPERKQSAVMPLLYLAQEGRGIGLINKLRAYALQDQGFDTVEANQRLGFADDERVFLAAAEMLRQLNISDVRLLTNNPRKVTQLEEYGVRVSERVKHSFQSNYYNERYLAVKAEKSGHLL